jgi:hypothetical protein
MADTNDDTSKETDIERSIRYRERSFDALRAARTAQAPEARASYEQMAEIWAKMADGFWRSPAASGRVEERHARPKA